MILSLLLAIIIPLLTAFSLVSAVWPGARPIRSDFVLKICLAVGIGLGILSCAYFLQLSLFGPSRAGFASTQVVLLVVAWAILFRRIKSKKNPRPGESVGERQPMSKLELTLSVLFFASLISATAAFVFISLRQPHGEWDAWAVYNMKARFLFRAGDYWRDIFFEPMGWTSPDYPLLIPAAVAGAWTLIGRDTVAVPTLVALLFTLATIGVVGLGISILRGKSQGALAGLVLASTPFFIRHGANQYTDIPLAFFFSSTIILLHLKDKFVAGERAFLFLAGLMVGLSAWTKNEGILFLVAIFASRFAVVFPKGGLRPYLRQMRLLANGLVPVLLVVVFFKATLASPNRMLFPPQGPSFVEKLFDLSRYWTILDGFVREGLGFGEGAVSLSPVLLFYLLLLGVGIKQDERASITASLIAVGIMVAGYFTVFVLTPLDLSLHLMTSLNRVFLHLWPSFIFIVFLIVRTPEHALAKADVISSPT